MEGNVIECTLVYAVVNGFQRVFISMVRHDKEQDKMLNK